MDVRSEGGEILEDYYIGHALNIEVELEPIGGNPAEIAALHNMHVGLVSELDEGEAPADGHTCYLGSMGGSAFQITDDGNVLFNKTYPIPERCLVDDEPESFNVWASINPSRVTEDMEEGDLNPDDVNAVLQRRL